MPHSTATFYKEDDESRQIMGLESLALGLGMGGMGVGMGMEIGIGMDMDMTGMEMGIAPTATTTTTMMMKEEEDPGSPSREKQAAASETTLALINEPQFIFEFPGQDDENSTGNSNINSTHNTTLEHETMSPSSDNFISIPPLSSSFTLPESHSLDSYPGTSTYNSTSAIAAAASLSNTASVASGSGTGIATLFPLLDERHPPGIASAAAVAAISPSSLRPGSPTTESMRSMMSVFRVDPFASYDADAGSRRKRRKRGSSYAMLSDPEKTSREEPLMFTFQIEASPGSEYYENYHQHLGDIAGPSSAMVLDALSTPSPHSSPSINILAPGSMDYYHPQSSFQQDSASAEYNPYLQSAVDSEDFSNMILATNTQSIGETASGSSRSTTAFSHFYPGYTTHPRQSHPSFQHTLGMNTSSIAHHPHHHSALPSSHHHHHRSPSNPVSDLTLNPTQETAYMLQNMRQSMGMHLGNLNVQGISMIGANTMSTPVTAGLRHSYQPTSTTNAGPSSSVMNMPVQSQQRTSMQPVLSSLQVVNAGHSIPPPMDSLSVSAVSHLDDIIDHLRPQEDDSVTWSTPPLPPHAASLPPSHHQRHPYHHSRYSQSQNRNQGFGDRPSALEDMREGGTGDSGHLNALRKMQNRSESLSEYPNDAEAGQRPDSQNEDFKNDDDAEDEAGTNPEVENQPRQSQTVASLQYGPLSPCVDEIQGGIRAEIDAGGPDGTNDAGNEPAGDRERTSEIRNLTAGKLAPSPLVVALGNDVEKTESPKTEFGRSQEFGTPFNGFELESNAESGSETAITTRLKPFSQKSAVKRFHGDVGGGCTYECKNEPDSSFSYYKDDNGGCPNTAYSDVRELSLPERCRNDVADGISNSLEECSGAVSADTQTQERAYPSCYSGLRTTSRTAYRLNAAQFDLDLDPYFDSLSPSEAEVQDVNIIAVDESELQVAPRAAAGGDYRSEPNPKLNDSSSKSLGGTDVHNTKFNSTNHPSGEFPHSASTSSFTTPDSEAVQSESGSAPELESESCQDHYDPRVSSSKPTIVGHRFFPSAGTTAFPPDSTSPESQFQAGPESETWKAFDDTTMMPASSALTSLSSASQQIPHTHISRQIQSQSPPLFKLKPKNSPNPVEIALSRSVDGYLHSTPGTGTGAEHIDYVHPKPYQQDGMVLQATLHSSISPGFPFPSSSTSSIGTGGSKMHICWICHKEFPRPSGLATHMNTHSGLKPYKCPIPTCSKTFAVRSNARRHLRIHGLGTHNSNLISESSNSSDGSTSTYNNPHYYESSGSAYEHPFHPSSYYSSHQITSSLLAPSNNMIRTRYQGDNEENRRDISRSQPMSTITSHSAVSPPPRDRFSDSHTVNGRGLIQNLYHPYRKAYSHLPSPRLDDCSYGTPLRLASLSSDSTIPYSSIYSRPDIMPLEMYELHNEDIKTEFNLVLNDVENKMELADSDFYDTRLQEELNAECGAGIQKLEELESPDHLQPKGSNDVGSTTKNFSDDEDHSTISDTCGLPSNTPTQRPTSTSTHISRRSISEIDTPTLSTVSTVSADSGDLNMAAVAPGWTVMSSSAAESQNYETGHDLQGDNIYHPIASLPPSAITHSLSAYNLATEPNTADRSPGP